MTRSKLEAFFREFPWLEGLIKKDPELEISVKRIDLELYKRERQSFDCGFLWPDWVFEGLFVLNKEGQLMGRVGYGWQSDDKSWPKFRNSEQDTLEDLFKRLGVCAPDVKFVLSVYGGGVIIYKAPKDKTVLAFIEEEIKKAHDEIKTQLATIDGESPSAA